MALAAIVVVHAAIQALLVLGDPVPSVDLVFVALALGSVAALVVASWLAVRVLVGPGGGRLLVGLSTLGVVVVASALSVLLPPLALIALVLGLIIVPGVAVGDAREGFRAFRRAPVRHGLAIVVVVLVFVASWAIALLLGLLVTGFAAALATWLWFGLVGVVVLGSWVRMARPAPLKR